MKRVAALLLVSLTLALQACGTEQKDDTQAEAEPTGLELAADGGASDPGKFVSMLRRFNSFEFTPTSGPDELREQVDVVAVGPVTNVAEGRITGPLDQGPIHHIVLTIEPTRVYKSPEGAQPEVVHVELLRPDNVPASEFREAIRNGTRALIFGYQRAEDRESDGPITNPYAGRTKGQPLYGPDPQGLFIEQGGEAVSALVGPDQMTGGWGELDTIDEILAELEDDASAPTPAPTPTSDSGP